MSQITATGDDTRRNTVLIMRVSVALQNDHVEWSFILDKADHAVLVAGENRKQEEADAKGTGQKRHNACRRAGV
jgi:hypothetical protein